MVGATASLAWTKIHEEVERSWPWLLGALALTVAGSLVGLVLGGVLGLIVGLALGLVSFPVGLRAATRVREIEHGGDR
jgi:ABC-type amino acid transport system permease subunit